MCSSGVDCLYVVCEGSLNAGSENGGEESCTVNWKMGSSALRTKEAGGRNEDAHDRDALNSLEVDGRR